MSKLLMNYVAGYLFLTQSQFSRWLPIHVKDMVQLQHKHPEVLKEFRRGNFVVQKSEKKISFIPKDHSHEQMTCSAKMLRVLQTCLTCHKQWMSMSWP